MQRILAAVGLLGFGLLLAACGSSTKGVSSNDPGIGGSSGSYGSGGSATGGAASGGTAGTGSGGAAGTGSGGTAGTANGGAAGTGGTTVCAIRTQACHDCWAKCDSSYKRCLTDTSCEPAYKAYGSCVCQAQDAGGSTASCTDALKSSGNAGYELWKCTSGCATACGT